MSKSKVTAPYNNLEEIAYRKLQLREQITRQERKLAQDIDAYQEDIETYKKLWSGIKGVRQFGHNFSSSGITQAVRTVSTLPLGKRAKSGGKSRWFTAFTLGAEVANWIIQRRRKGRK